MNGVISRGELVTVEWGNGDWIAANEANVTDRLSEIFDDRRDFFGGP